MHHKKVLVQQKRKRSKKVKAQSAFNNYLLRTDIDKAYINLLNNKDIRFIDRDYFAFLESIKNAMKSISESIEVAINSLFKLGIKEGVLSESNY